jgi:cell cycle related kinase
MSFPGFSNDLQLTERYKYVKSLGQGAFGEVLLAEDVCTCQHIAVKQLYLPEPGAPLPTAVAREVSALQQLQHPNIIRLLDVAVSGCCVYLCQELCCTDLAAVLSAADQQLPPQLVCSLMQQLLAALAACHEAGIMHRDVKPANILITPSGCLKLADFGLAKRFKGHAGSTTTAEHHDNGGSSGAAQCDSQHPKALQQHPQPALRFEGLQQQDNVCCSGNLTPAQGTRWYRSPELLYGSCSYGPEVDVWAAGIVMAELLGLTPLIPGQSDIDQLARMQHVLGSITPQAWPAVVHLPDWHKVSFGHCEGQELSALLPDAPPAALDLLQLLLVYDPGKRPSAAAALRHPYFQSVVGL